MGHAIDRESFDPSEYVRFGHRLGESLRALATLLERPGFGCGPPTVGAELEMHLVDAGAQPLSVNRRVLANTSDRRLVPELDGFNLECNARPCSLAGAPFRTLGAELDSALRESARAAARAGARVVTIGLLPTLRLDHLGGCAITRLPRYRAISSGLRSHRDAPFAFRIAGIETLEVDADDVSPVGATTSLQFHLRVEPHAFARFFNAAQLVTAPALALCGNAPIFLGARLWQETRIAVFGQGVDDRSAHEEAFALPARVGFGLGWVRRGAWELFAESVALHPPVLPVLGDEDPLEVVRGGGVPKLEELRLHHGTIYAWNRPVYDPADGGHLRIELRALPAGPTVRDMLANGALILGLVLAFAEEIDGLLPGIPFENARRNFYAAARDGLDAMLLWPSPDQQAPRVVAARDLLAELLPRAREALLAAGVEIGDVAEAFDTLAERLRTGQTGARWQLRALETLEATRSRDAALAEMLGRYAELAATGAPVHTWPAG